MGDYGLNETFEYSELCLDSWDATNPGAQSFESSASNPALIKFSWPQYYFTDRQPRVAALKVVAAEIPFVYDVITPVNNTFLYTSNAVPSTITIPTGTYTGTSLATQLQTLLGGITPGFLVTFSSTTLKFTFTYPNATAWSLFFGSRKTAYSPMGFVPLDTTYTNTGIASTITSAIIAQITGPYYIYINSQQLGPLVNFNLCDSSIGTNRPEICKIQVNANPGEVIFYNDYCEKYFDYFTGLKFDSMDFYLTLGSDQYQKPLDLKGAPWSLTLGIISYRPASKNLYSKEGQNSQGGSKRTYTTIS
jgi:hypothetical protein